jgi:hypothetical protein
MTERNVWVSGKRHTVEVHQKSKSVWEAVGVYRDKTIRVKGQSEGDALNHWCEAARQSLR